MNKENPFGLEACSQIQGLLKGVEGGSGDVLGRVPETMFQPLLKYPRLEDQQIGFLNLIPMLWEGLDIAGSIDHLPSWLFKDINEGQLGTSINRDGRGPNISDLEVVTKKHELHQTLS